MALKRDILVRKGPKPLSLLGQPDDQFDQCSDQVQDRGNEDDGLECFVLITAFLFPGHLFSPRSLQLGLIIYQLSLNVKQFFQLGLNFSCFYIVLVLYFSHGQEV